MQRFSAKKASGSPRSASPAKREQFNRFSCLLIIMAVTLFYVHAAPKDVIKRRDQLITSSGAAFFRYKRLRLAEVRVPRIVLSFLSLPALPDNSVIGLISFVPMTFQRGSQGRRRLKRRENNVKELHAFFLTAKAKIWPRLSYMCRVCADH